MTSILFGTTNETYIASPVKIVSILVAVSGAVSVDFHIHDGQNTVKEPTVHIHGAAGWTEQYQFRGIPFPNGFTVQPDSNTTYYLIEYEPLA